VAGDVGVASVAGFGHRPQPRHAAGHGAGHSDPEINRYAEIRT
jgi:hypothetical protein